MRRRGKKFTEPVALSSPDPAGSPLPRTTLGLGFDLPALRARCNPHSRPLRQRVQARRLQKARSLRKNHMRCLRWRFVAHALQGSGARRRGFEASAAGRGRARPPERESRSLRRTCPRRCLRRPREGKDVSAAPLQLDITPILVHSNDDAAWLWDSVVATRTTHIGAASAAARSSRVGCRYAAVVAGDSCRSSCCGRTAQLVKLDRAREPA